MSASRIRLKILLPFRVFAERDDVSRIVAETARGFFGILPRRLDGAAALVPGILIYQSDTDGEQIVAVDEGILVKTGGDVIVSVRHAVAGADLDRLREAVEREFLNLDERELAVRQLLAKLETGLVRRMMEFSHE